MEGRAAKMGRQPESPRADGNGGRRRQGRTAGARPAKDAPAILQAIARTAARLCDASNAHIYRLEGDQLRLEAIQGSEPMRRVGQAVPVTRELPSGCAVLDRRTVHVRDTKTANAQRRYPGLQPLHSDLRTLLATPLLRDGVAVGLIIIWRARVRPFTAKQLELLRTFADQAAIALENERLRAALEARNRELTEGLERETVTGDILRIISRSLIDVQPVLEAIVESATRLCGASFGSMVRFDGQLLTLSVLSDASPEEREAAHSIFPAPLSRGRAAGRAILERRIIHIHDVRDDPEYTATAIQRTTLGYRTVLSVPLLRDGEPIGALVMWRRDVRPFSEKQIDLMTTFADQAVIAIENVRLFTELETRNRDLTEALEQQTATSEILRVISSSPTDVQPVLDAVAENAARVCGANEAQVFRIDGDALCWAAAHGSFPGSLGRGDRTPISRGFVFGRAVIERRTIHVPDMATESEAEYPSSVARQKMTGFRTVVATPLLREGAPIGVISIRRMEVRPFSDKQIRLLETFADQAVIAIENVRLFTELEAKNRDLTEALDQQTATGEILRVISSSPTDVQPVFDTISRSAMRLCDAAYSVVARYDGELLHLVAHASVRAEGVEALQQVFPMRPSRATTTSRAILDRAVVHVPDVLEDADYAQPVAHALQNRSTLAVPMLRDGEPIGTISVGRLAPWPFSEKQIELLKTFADQAVIAIENVRLFTELEARNSELTVALEQQTATSEILRVISSSPTDVQPVFDTIARNASRLCNGLHAIVTRFDGELLHLVAQHNVRPDAVEATARLYPRAPGRDVPSARVILERAVVHIPDMEADRDVSTGTVRAVGARSFLVVPMLREGLPIGTIGVSRVQAGSFPPDQIDLLKVFADQAVIAIENVRLFQELEARNRELTEALEQQTATSEILRVISSSPTDVQPVFQAIAVSAARLCGAFDAIVLRVDGDQLRLVAHTGPLSASDVPLHRGTVGGRAVLERRVIHVQDLQAEADEFPEGSALARRRGHRTDLSVPLLRDGVAIGNIQVRRDEVRSFSDKQSSLLQTFADQAVIAIENVRLFQELEARNRDLTEALEQQTATSGSAEGHQPVDVRPPAGSRDARRECAHGCAVPTPASSSDSTATCFTWPPTTGRRQARRTSCG